MQRFRKIAWILLIALALTGCFRTGVGRSGIQSNNLTETTEIPVEQTRPTARPTVTLIPTVTGLPPAPKPHVTITAATGNLYIRRGPGFEYNWIGVLTKGTSADIVGQDVLSKWVQINVPNENFTGWVSNQSQFTTIEGNLDSIPNFTFTEWPEPAYIKNCTEHDMFITPGDIVLPSLYTNSKYLNEIQVNPGEYTAFDLFYPEVPEAQILTLHEGMTAYITTNGLGDDHKCP